ncbi:MAG: Mur ligase family protein [Pseudomonadota bacterium]
MSLIKTPEKKVTPQTLNDWLSWIGRVHPHAMVLDVERVAAAGRKMDVLNFDDTPVVTVAGTNGKGSTASGIAACCAQAGLRTGLFLSPHLLTFNERIQWNGQPISDDALCEAFAAVERARGDILLTYFEFTTLAALWTFTQRQAQVVVLEVGLGGRLDATNIVDATHAVVSTIALDHTHILGETRDEIARQKAGIFRPKQYIYLGPKAADVGVLREAAQACTPNVQYTQPYQEKCSIPRESAGLVRAVCGDLSKKYPALNERHVSKVLREFSILGRFSSMVTRAGTWVFDVAHNPEGGLWLAEQLAANPVRGITYALWGSFMDKDQQGIVAPLCPHIDQWMVLRTVGERGASVQHLSGVLEQSGGKVFAAFEEAKEAVKTLLSQLQTEDRVVVFGGFDIVSRVYPILSEQG